MCNYFHFFLSSQLAALVIRKFTSKIDGILPFELILAESGLFHYINYLSINVL